MKITKSRGLLALAIYLLLVGLDDLLKLNLGQFSVVVPILALVAGVLILIGR
ncbi:MAG: hypothetical protein J0L73_02725 [Verrucomicrobia bacterium]|nr:hypothetical protein [Verrucomicrobiota bacterium]